MRSANARLAKIEQERVAKLVVAQQVAAKIVADAAARQAGS